MPRAVLGALADVDDEVRLSTVDPLLQLVRRDRGDLAPSLLDHLLDANSHRLSSFARAMLDPRRGARNAEAPADPLAEIVCISSLLPNPHCAMITAWLQRRAARAASRSWPFRVSRRWTSSGRPRSSRWPTG